MTLLDPATVYCCIGPAIAVAVIAVLLWWGRRRFGAANDDTSKGRIG